MPSMLFRKWRSRRRIRIAYWDPSEMIWPRLCRLSVSHRAEPFAICTRALAERKVSTVRTRIVKEMISHPRRWKKHSMVPTKRCF